MVSEDYTVVLLFDNNDDSADLITRKFSAVDVPHQVRRVTNSDAMIKYLNDSNNKEGSEKDLRPKLIVIHTDSFDKNIESVVSYIKNDAEFRRIPVVVFSKSGDEASIQKAYELKTNSYIEYPDSSEQIENVVGEVASYWLNWNQLPS